MITIQDFVHQNILVCVSSLVYTLTQEGKLDEELAIELWTGPYDYDAAEYEIEQAGGKLIQEDDYWGVYGENVCYWLIDPIHNSKDDAIDDYFDGDLDEYRQEVYEHWIVSSWLSGELQKYGETIVEDFYGLTVWCRCTTGQAIYCDYIIQEIYKELITTSTN